MSETSHARTGQPIGEAVDARPAQRPGMVTLQGRFGRMENLTAEHAAGLWQAMQGHDRIWTYMPSYGPFADAAAFNAWVATRAALDDPRSYAIVDNAGRALGIMALMAIREKDRVVEVGHVLYAPALQRTPLATEAQYLLARYVFETLGYRRYEWKCDALNAPSRRAARALWLHLRGHLPPAHDRQGPQPRHRLARRCSTASGRRAKPISSAGSRRGISTPAATRSKASAPLNGGAA